MCVHTRTLRCRSINNIFPTDVLTFTNLFLARVILLDVWDDGPRWHNLYLLSYNHEQFQLKSRTFMMGPIKRCILQLLPVQLNVEMGFKCDRKISKSRYFKMCP